MNCIKRECCVNMKQLHITAPIRKFIPTKAVINLLIAAICLTFVGQARATATYDAEAYLRVGFDPAINSYTQPYDQNTGGSGSHYEIVSLSWGMPNSPGPYHWFSVGSGVHGWAGDATGTTDGTSEASLTTKWVLNFIFPDITATPLTLTKLASNVQANTDASLMFESASATASISMLLDGIYNIWFDSNDMYTTNLTGSHSITLIASTAGSASASYQSVPVPEPSTMLLFGFGLVGLAGVRRKLHK